MGDQEWQEYAVHNVDEHDVPFGGMMALNEEMQKNNVPPHWLASVGVDNVDDSLAKATQLGAKTVAPAMDIPGAGRYAIFQDPQGATIAIFAPEGDMQSAAEGPPKNGEFSWHELTTSDYLAAFDFYSKLFGWERTASSTWGRWHLPDIRQGRDDVRRIFTRTPTCRPPNWLCYIKVPDAKESARHRSAWWKDHDGPMEVPGGEWIAVAADPQGAMTAVQGPRPLTHRAVAATHCRLRGSVFIFFSAFISPHGDDDARNSGNLYAGIVVTCCWPIVTGPSWSASEVTELLVVAVVITTGIAPIAVLLNASLRSDHQTRRTL